MEDGEVDLGYLPTCLPTELCGIEGKGREGKGKERNGRKGEGRRGGISFVVVII
jgi:hypothetical protein